MNVEDGIVRYSKVLERVLMHFISGADDLGAYVSWAAARPSWFTHKIGQMESIISSPTRTC